MTSDERINPHAILAKHYDPASELYGLLLTHSLLVTRKARELGEAYLTRHPEASVDMEFLTEAGLLHDIGIGRCDAPDIFCHGKSPYICHGVIGREILDAEGLPRHALVCERHSGSGIGIDEVREEKLPIPERDYLPLSLEEKLICVADKFYSKSGRKVWKEKSPGRIADGLAKWGQPTAERWRALCEEIAPQAHPDFLDSSGSQ